MDCETSKSILTRFQYSNVFSGRSRPRLQFSSLDSALHQEQDATLHFLAAYCASFPTFTVNRTTNPQINGQFAILDVWLGSSQPWHASFGPPSSGVRNPTRPLQQFDP